MSDPVCLKGKCEGPSWWGCGQVRGCYERAKEGYAEAMVQRDRLTAHEGRPDQDMSARGTTLRPGR